MRALADAALTPVVLGTIVRTLGPGNGAMGRQVRAMVPEWNAERGPPALATVAHDALPHGR